MGSSLNQVQPAEQVSLKSVSNYLRYPDRQKWTNITKNIMSLAAVRKDAVCH